MTRSAFIALALPCLALGACESSFQERYQAALPVEQRLPFVVDNQVATLDIVTDPSGRLSTRAQNAVAGFVQSFKADSASVLEIQTAGGDRAAAQSEGEIRDLASLYGVPRNRIRVVSYVPEPGSRASIRLAYQRLVASVPACDNPDWSQNLSMTWDNSTYPNFGCATQKNVAAMAGDPRDLVQMKPIDAASAQRRDTMMGKYEKGQSPSSERTKGDSGKLAPTVSGTDRQ